MANPEFDAALALAEWERDKADWVKSMGNASKLAADYQHRAEVAEAALARVGTLCGAISAAQGDANYLAEQGQCEYHDFLRDLRAAMKEPK